MHARVHLVSSLKGPTSEGLQTEKSQGRSGRFEAAKVSLWQEHLLACGT